MTSAEESLRVKVEVERYVDQFKKELLTVLNFDVSDRGRYGSQNAEFLKWKVE